MDTRKLRNWEIAGFFFTAVAGTLLHFVYEWSGEAAAVGFFGAVNESVWEHLKLLMVPMILFTVAEFIFWGRRAPCFLPIKFLSVLIGMLVITAVFYTYTGALGEESVVVDIILFFVADYVMYRYSFKRLAEDESCAPLVVILAALGFILLITAIVVFTLNPPHIPLFQDPVTGTYGAIK